MIKPYDILGSLENLESTHLYYRNLTDVLSTLFMLGLKKVVRNLEFPKFG